MTGLWVSIDLRSAASVPLLGIAKLPGRKFPKMEPRVIQIYISKT